MLSFPLALNIPAGGKKLRAEGAPGPTLAGRQAERGGSAPFAKASGLSDRKHRKEGMKNTLLIFDKGYTGRALAESLDPDQWRVIGTGRHGGADTLRWPGTDMRGVLEQSTHLLVSIAPDEDGDPVLNRLAGEIAKHASRLDWVGYLSTTGVYGDHQGGWVDEDTPLAPATRRGELRVKAEADWQALAARCGLPLHIFRLAGIYGPGRGPFAKVRRGTARRIIKPGQVFSRIHMADIVQVLRASMAQPNPGRIYNVCDDLAAPPEDVLGFAADLLGLPQPPSEDYATADMSAMARSFYAESKRVRNDRIKSELGVSLRYPTYKDGLRALLASDGEAGQG